MVYRVVWTALGKRGLVSGMDTTTWHVIIYIYIYMHLEPAPNIAKEVFSIFSVQFVYFELDVHIL